MALTHKPGPAEQARHGVNEYPEELIPQLPAALRERFPEMEAWERTARENYRKLVDVLSRRDRE